MNYLRLCALFLLLAATISLLLLRSPDAKNRSLLNPEETSIARNARMIDKIVPVSSMQAEDRILSTGPGILEFSREIFVSTVDSRGQIEAGKTVTVNALLYAAGIQESTPLLSFSGALGDAIPLSHHSILDKIPEGKRVAFSESKIGIKFQVDSGDIVSSFDPIVYAPLPSDVVVEVEASASLIIRCEESPPFQFGELYLGSVALSPRSGRTDSQHFPKMFNLSTEEPAQVDGLVAGEYVVTLGDEDLSFSSYQVAFAVRGETVTVVFPASGAPVDVLGRCLYNPSGDTDFVVAIRGTGANVDFQAEVGVTSTGEFQAKVPADGEYFAYLVSKEQLGISHVMVPLEQQFLIPPDVAEFDLTLRNGLGSITVEEVVATESVCRGDQIFLMLDSDSSSSPRAWDSIVSDVVALGVFDEEGQCCFDNVPAGDYRLEFTPGERQLRMPVSQLRIEDTTQKRIRFSPPRPHSFSVSLREDGEKIDITRFAPSPLLLKSGNELAAENLISVWSRVTSEHNAISSWAPALFEIGEMPGVIKVVGPDSGHVELFVRVLDAGIVKSIHLGPIHFPDPRSEDIVAELVRSSGIRVRTESVSGLAYPFHIFVQDGAGLRLPLFGGANFQKFEQYLPGLPPGEYGIYVATSDQSAAQRSLTLKERDVFVTIILN